MDRRDAPVFRALAHHALGRFAVGEIARMGFVGHRPAERTIPAAVPAQRNTVGKRLDDAVQPLVVQPTLASSAVHPEAPWVVQPDAEATWTSTICSLGSKPNEAAPPPRHRRSPGPSTSSSSGNMSS